jgi:hypothetical protein
MFWFVKRSSADTVFGFPVYGEHSERIWFKLTILPVYEVARQLVDAKWWLFHRVHPAHRYHVVKTGLKPGYYDVDTLMLHSSFQLLCRYVEQEMGGVAAMEKNIAELRREGSEPGGETRIACAERESEALALYRWWKFEKPAEEKHRDGLCRQLHSNERENMRTSTLSLNKRSLRRECRALEEKIDADEQKMLHRLIEIRRSLWT